VLDLPHHDRLESGDYQSHLVEDPPPERHLRELPPDRWPSLELRDLQLHQRVPHAGVQLATEFRPAQADQLRTDDLHGVGMPSEWLVEERRSCFIEFSGVD
jgi:hypothetical protein